MSRVLSLSQTITQTENIDDMNKPVTFFRLRAAVIKFLLAYNNVTRPQKSEDGQVLTIYASNFAAYGPNGITKALTAGEVPFTIQRHFTDEAGAAYDTKITINLRWFALQTERNYIDRALAVDALTA